LEDACPSLSLDDQVNENQSESGNACDTSLLEQHLNKLLFG
jgi:hypothetical protein